MINIFLLLPVFLFSSLLFADPFKDLNIDFLLEDAPSSQTKKSKGPKSKSAKKPFKEVIKNFKAIEGLFTIYWKESTNKAYLSLTPQQLEKIYLAGITRQSGDALYLDGSSMLNEYPFLFKKVGERIQYVNANVLFRADESSPFRKSVERHKSHSILSSTKIESAPHPETGAILVDLGILFIYDMERITMRSQGVYVFDKKDSYF